MIRLWLKITENFVRLILQDRFWVVDIPLVRLVKFQFLAQFSVDYFLDCLGPSTDFHSFHVILKPLRTDPSDPMTIGTTGALMFYRVVLFVRLFVCLFVFIYFLFCLFVLFYFWSSVSIKISVYFSHCFFFAFWFSGNGKICLVASSFFFFGTCLKGRIRWFVWLSNAHDILCVLFFRFSHLPFGYTVKYCSLALFPLNYISQPVVLTCVLLCASLMHLQLI